MDSPNYCPNFDKSEEKLADGLSPMTDLAKNLSSLSTTRTPCRRISWNNQDDMKHYFFGLDDSPFAADSPSFQDGIVRGAEPKFKKKTSQCARKFLFKKIDTPDKENYAHVKSSKLFSSPSDSSFKDLSQESGFCDSTFEKRTELSFMSTGSSPGSVKSTFADEDGEQIFSMDKLLEEENLSNASPSSSMSQLFTKPLSDWANRLWDKERRPFEIPCKPVVRKVTSLVENSSTNFDLYPKRETFEVNLSYGDEANKKAKSRCSFKRPEPVHGSTPINSKRRKSSPTVDVPSSFIRTSLHRCYSETAATIMKAVQKSDEEPNLIGDGTRMYALPLISNGRHQDLKTVSPETLVRMMKGEFGCAVKNYIIIDCRYPYEYEGGHIKGAKNIYTKEDIQKALLSNTEPLPKGEQQSLIVFHCEFSSERAPKLLRFLRNKDREMNESRYPQLHHPELYILEGGYKDFFEKYGEFCQPQAYKPMLHKDHISELREFRSKSKSFGNDTKLRPKLRSNLKF